MGNSPANHGHTGRAAYENEISSHLRENRHQLQRVCPGSSQLHHYRAFPGGGYFTHSGSRRFPPQGPA